MLRRTIRALPHRQVHQECDHPHQPAEPVAQPHDQIQLPLRRDRQVPGPLVRVPEPEEERMRSFLMGWSPTSKTALTYTRRHVRLKAQRVSLQMQAAQVKGGPNND